MNQFQGAAIQVGAIGAIVLSAANNILPWAQLAMLITMIVLGWFQIRAFWRRSLRIDSLTDELTKLRRTCSKAAEGSCPVEARIAILEKEGLKLK